MSFSSSGEMPADQRAESLPADTTGFASLQPPPISLGAIGALDVDKAYGIDATQNMMQRGVTIQNVSRTTTIVRTDGTPVGVSDLAVTVQAVVSSPTNMVVNGISIVVQPGYGWTFTAQGRGNVAVYLIGFLLTLSDGSAITRWARIPTLATPG